MKKLLSILGVIGLTATSTTTLISCEKPNNNENGGGNKPTPEQQQLPENSKWTNIPRTQAPNKEFLTATNKWYFYINKYENNYITTKFYFDNNFIKNQNTWWQHLKNDSDFIWNYNLVYRWNKNNEPQIPKINKDTGLIIDWKE
ncbi:lipoprotein [Spiroplasma endosymbiont of Sarcophaga carnaria]|uniref:lipoprotein n=1 Tax=Spiroplasma endosymbiont of Sarcophaga carnaria TaxID=3066303 RepID=UPI0030CDD513